MYWADRIALELQKRNLPLEWVDDMKTPSGRVHVGSLRGVIIHDLIYKALLKQKQKAVYTYCINDMDPVDGGNFPDHMGWPLFKTPFAKGFAEEFISVFEKIGCQPKIVWTSDLYKDGKFDEIIKIFLDKTAEIRKLFKEQYQNQSFKEDDYYPYQPICLQCGKIATTKIYKWDGNDVYFRCQEKAVNYTKGCGFEGKVKPEKLNGKMPWKIEWSAHWKTLGVTVEWSGKDHMTAGGSHEIAAKISEKILNYPTPQAKSYEHLLIGGKKMSSSKGLGSSAKEVSEFLPPELLRFLMVRTDYKQAINFDLNGSTIPDLFDEYDRCAKEFWENGTKSDFGRIYELSQVDQAKPQKLVSIRFRQMVQLIQMPNVGKEIINSPELEERAKYAKIWLENFAGEEDKLLVKEEAPKEMASLSIIQRQLLSKISQEMGKSWEPEVLQTEIYNWGKELGLTPNQTFQSIYLSLLGKDHGPKAAWLILSLDKEFIKKRFVSLSF